MPAVTLHIPIAGPAHHDTLCSQTRTHTRAHTLTHACMHTQIRAHTHTRTHSTYIHTHTTRAHTYAPRAAAPTHPAPPGAPPLRPRRPRTPEGDPLLARPLQGRPQSAFPAPWPPAVGWGGWGVNVLNATYNEVDGVKCAGCACHTGKGGAAETQRGERLLELDGNRLQHGARRAWWGCAGTRTCSHRSAWRRS